MFRQTYALADGREIESEVERRGDRIRLRLRLCCDGIVTVAWSATVRFWQYLSWEGLPAEFRRDPQVQEAMFDAADEIWRLRLRAS